MYRCCKLLGTLAVTSLWLAGTAGAADWHHPLYLDGGGWWRARIRVTVRNETGLPMNGEPAAVSVGPGPGQAELAGEAAEAIRLVDPRGTELLFALYGPHGDSLVEGPIPAGGTLVLPAECPPSSTAVYYIYFDNPSASRLPDLLPARPGRIRASAERPERISMDEAVTDEPWRAPGGGPMAYDHRAVVKVFNFSTEPILRSVAWVDARVLENRTRGRLNPESIVVSSRGKRLPHLRFGDALLLETSLPRRSVETYYVYFSDNPNIRFRARADYAVLLESGRNLVRNPSFEEGDPLPTGWHASRPAQDPESATYGLDRSIRPSLGTRCAKMVVPHGAPTAWRGWRQKVPVEAGRTYLVAAWLKCERVPGSVRVHAHCLDADGRLSKRNAFHSVGPELGGTRDWTLLSGTIQVPEDTAWLELHLTMNQSGTLWHDGVIVAEVVPGRLVALEGRPLSDSDGPTVWPVHAVQKVFPDDLVPSVIGPARIRLARNEKEPLQLAVRSGRALPDVRVEVDPPASPDGERLEDVEVHVVGYVPVDHPTNYYRSDAPAWHRKIPSQPGRCDGWPGLWPDPLLPANTFDLEPNTTQPIWIIVGVPKSAAAGDYTGTARLVCRDEPVAEVPFSVHVWDFALPDENHVAAIYDVRLGRGKELWGKPLEEIYPEMIRFMAARRLCPDRVRPAPVFKLEGGRTVADFTEFDKAAELYFDELKFPFAYAPSTFYLFGWGHPPKTFLGQRPYEGDPPYRDADRGRLRPEYKRAFQACLKAFWNHVKDKGWEKKIVLYISDEPFDRHEHIIDQMKALCEMIHEVDPEIPIYSSTWKHVPEWEDHLDVWGIGHDGRVSPEKMAELRAAGDRLWFTTDGQMCTDTPYCAVERLLPHYCFKYGVEAYEFWGVAWLTYDPYRYGWHSYIRQTSEPGTSFWVRYPNGDGFLIYPGGPIGHEGLVSSIRLEQAREGVEDYEYLYLLRRLIAEAKAVGRNVAQAEEAMKQAAALVEIPNAGGRYSSQILPDPNALYAVRQQLAAAIEQLTR